MQQEERGIVLECNGSMLTVQLTNGKKKTVHATEIYEQGERIVIRDHIVRKIITD